MSEVSNVPPNGDDRLWALLAHLSVFVLGIIGPLIIWLVKKEESTFVADHAKEALNFQLAVMIVSTVCMLTCVLAPAVLVIAVGGMIYAVLAAVEANNGRYYRYPYTIRLIN